MKFKTVITSTLSLVLIAAPAAVLAHDSSVSVEADGTTVQEVELQGPHGPSKAIIRTHPAVLGSTTTPPRGAMKDSDEARPKPTGEKMQGRADSAIDARIARLNALISRIDAAERLSADAKASLKAELTAEVNALTELKAKIAADTDPEMMKADAESITKSYRVYALVLPRAAITAASERIMTIVGQMQTFSAKLDARIDVAASAGADVSAAQAALSDFNAKIADASVQAQAAASAVVNLSVDNGDKTVLEANVAALKNAKAKIDAAQTDLKAARKDIDAVLKAVKGTGEVKASANASATTGTQ